MSTNKNLVVGVDGGGTKTAVVCVDAKTREVLSKWKGGCTNFNSVGSDQAKETLLDGIKNVVSQVANHTLDHVVAVSLGMSGVDRPADKEKVTSWMNDLFGKRAEEVKILISNDAVAALASGTNGVLANGVVVISGTGMIVYGFDENEKEKRSGGWGPLLGDQGSGYAIGSDILRAVVSAADGRGPETALTSAVFSQLNITAADQLIPWAYSDRNPSWQKFADLAPLASQVVKGQNDQVALRILENAANELSKNIVTVVEHLKLNNSKSFTLVLAGGNLTHEGSRLAELLQERLKQHFNNVNITKPVVEPEVAVALLVINRFSL